MMNAVMLWPTTWGSQRVSESSRESSNPEIMLGLLSSVERDSGITQRKLAQDLGIALGLANAYLRRCVRKGLVKMSQVPLNRYAYYLTPQGFAEKSRLTAEYLSVSFDFFRRARSECTLLLGECANRGWRKVALYGAGDLAEIAVLSAREAGIEVVCVIDPSRAGHRCAGLAVVADLVAAQACSGGRLDGVILTDTRAPQARFDEVTGVLLQQGLTGDSLVAPQLLGISPIPAVDEAGA